MEEYMDLGFRLTPQRIAVLEYLDGNTAHPSAEDIYKAVLERFPTTSFATVYNTLNALKERGRILELSIDPDRRRFDPNPVAHHHLMCVSCKRVVDVHKQFLLELSGNEAQGFDVTGNQVEFYGVCPECKGKRSD